MILNGLCHTDGDDGCHICSLDYPYQCACGGLIHAEKLASHVYITKCDTCGIIKKSNRYVAIKSYGSVKDQSYSGVQDVGQSSDLRGREGRNLHQGIQRGCGDGRGASGHQRPRTVTWFSGQ